MTSEIMTANTSLFSNLKDYSVITTTTSIQLSKNLSSLDEKFERVRTNLEQASCRQSQVFLNLNLEVTSKPRRSTFTKLILRICLLLKKCLGIRTKTYQQYRSTCPDQVAKGLYNFIHYHLKELSPDRAKSFLESYQDKLAQLNIKTGGRHPRVLRWSQELTSLLHPNSVSDQHQLERKK